MKKYTVLTVLLGILAVSVLTGCRKETDIGQESAKKIALEHAGIQEADASNLRISRGDEDGQKTYDIEFDYQEWEYDYEIGAANGQILSADEEVRDNYNLSTATDYR